MKSNYSYTFKLLALAAAASNSDKIEMEKGIDFTAEGISFKVFDTATKTVVADPYVLVNFKPTGSAGTLLDESCPIGNVAGSGETPHVINTPWKFNGNTSPVLEAENKTAAAVDIYVTLHGYRENEGI